MLKQFSDLPTHATQEPTLQEISGYPHYENVASNILAFFLDSEAGHKLGSLLAEAVLSCLPGEFQEAPSYSGEVEREASTDKNQRLDIVFRTDKYLIGIENKIFHWVANDLQHYRDYFKGTIKGEQVEWLGIVLSPKPLSGNDAQKAIDAGFHTITYEELGKKVYSLIGAKLSQANLKYTTYLTDLFQSIENLSLNTMNQQMIEFFATHKEALNTLFEEKARLDKEIKGKVLALSELMGEQGAESECRKWIFRSFCLVFDLSKHGIAIDTILEADGWRINVFFRGNEGNNKNIPEFLRERGFQAPQNEKSPYNTRWCPFQASYSADLSVVKEVLEKILEAGLKG
ncbi:MAG: PD-(D/E)XK nuclease family protein [Bacteroidia bacterium]|nr:PD-(D/E)XK nuclease family protein [Bacteroidia bacterium]